MALPAATTTTGPDAHDNDEPKPKHDSPCECSFELPLHKRKYD